MRVITIFRVGIALIKNLLLKIFNWKRFKCSFLNAYSLSTNIIIHKGGRLSIGKHLSTMSDVTISVANRASLTIGNMVNLNKSCSIISKNNVIIGDNVLFGPNCGVYDHDHDYRSTGRERQEKFITGEVVIGNGVWFGANCIVLRNTTIGDNCVFGAGSIIKGNYPANTIVVQKREEFRKEIESIY